MTRLSHSSEGALCAYGLILLVLVLSNDIAQSASNHLPPVLTPQTGRGECSDYDQYGIVGNLATAENANRVAVQGDYAYMALGDEGLQVIDISDPHAPQSMGLLDFTLSNQVYNLAVRGNYVYLATHNGLVVVDVSNIGSPVIIGTANNTSDARDIALVGDYACIITGGYDYTLKMVNISNPASPAVSGVAHFSEPLEAVTVRGTYAYVGDQTGLRTVDISNPSHPILGNHCATWGEPLLDIDISGNYLYGINLMRLIKFHIGDPANPNISLSFETGGHPCHALATVDNGAYVANDSYGLGVGCIVGLPYIIDYLDIPGAAVGVAASNGYAFVAADTGGLVVVYAPGPIGGRVLDQDIVDGVTAGDYAYIAELYELTVMNISVPASPVVVSNLSIGRPRSLTVSGNYVYLVGYGGLQVVDVSTPSSPVVMGDVQFTSYPTGVAVQASYAYVVDGSRYLYVVEVSNPSDPVIVGSLALPGTPVKIAVVGGNAYVSAMDGGFLVANIASPSSPELVARLESVAAKDAVVRGGHAFVACAYSGLYVVDVGNPEVPAIVSSVLTASPADGLVVSGSYVYIESSLHKVGFTVVDVSDLSMPVESGSILTGQVEFIAASEIRECVLLGINMKTMSAWELNCGGTAWWVDCDNIAGPWDGSSQHPFLYIIDAYQAASNGDRIFISSGQYPENLTFDKLLRVESVGGAVRVGS